MIKKDQYKQSYLYESYHHDKVHIRKKFRELIDLIEGLEEADSSLSFWWGCQEGLHIISGMDRSDDGMAFRWRVESDYCTIPPCQLIHAFMWRLSCMQTCMRFPKSYVNFFRASPKHHNVTKSFAFVLPLFMPDCMCIDSCLFTEISRTKIIIYY